MSQFAFLVKLNDLASLSELRRRNECGRRTRGGSARCPSCGASVPVPARSAPSADSTEVHWSDQAGLPPVRRREVPPPPVIDVVDADELASGKGRLSPKRPPADTRWESQPADQSQYTAAELGHTKSVSPLRPSRKAELASPTVIRPNLLTA